MEEIRRKRQELAAREEAERTRVRDEEVRERRDREREKEKERKRAEREDRVRRQEEAELERERQLRLAEEAADQRRRDAEAVEAERERQLRLAEEAADQRRRDAEAAEAERARLAEPQRPRETYEKLAQVGEGTYGKVYKARNTETGAFVALKRIRMEGERDGFPVTAMREIKLLQSLRHPNVVALHEMMVSQGVSCPSRRRRRATC
jgi:hypothetical protein